MRQKRENEQKSESLPEDRSSEVRISRRRLLTLSGGLAPSISDMSTEGGSTLSAVFDCGTTGGISVFNLFITAAGIGVAGAAGDLQAYSLTIDMCRNHGPSWISP
jgi:hypothetical protein